MKEYICVDDTFKRLDKDERKFFLKLISKSMRYTKAAICREFFRKALSKYYSIDGAFLEDCLVETLEEMEKGEEYVKERELRA